MLGIAFLALSALLGDAGEGARDRIQAVYNDLKKLGEEGIEKTSKDGVRYRTTLPLQPFVPDPKAVEAEKEKKSLEAEEARLEGEGAATEKTRSALNRVREALRAFHRRWPNLQDLLRGDAAYRTLRSLTRDALSTLITALQERDWKRDSANRLDPDRLADIASSWRVSAAVATAAEKLLALRQEARKAADSRRSTGPAGRERTTADLAVQAWEEFGAKVNGFAGALVEAAARIARAALARAEARYAEAHVALGKEKKDAARLLMTERRRLDRVKAGMNDTIARSALERLTRAEAIARYGAVARQAMGIDHAIRTKYLGRPRPSVFVEKKTSVAVIVEPNRALFIAPTAASYVEDGGRWPASERSVTLADGDRLALALPGVLYRVYSNAGDAVGTAAARVHAGANVQVRPGLPAVFEVPSPRGDGAFGARLETAKTVRPLDGLAWDPERKTLLAAAPEITPDEIRSGAGALVLLDGPSGKEVGRIPILLYGLLVQFTHERYRSGSIELVLNARVVGECSLPAHTPATIRFSLGEGLTFPDGTRTKKVRTTLGAAKTTMRFPVLRGAKGPRYADAVLVLGD